MDYERNTWIDPEELAYNTRNGGAWGSQRRCQAFNPEGKLRTYKVGIPDTMFSIPAIGREHGKYIKGFVYVEDNTLFFSPEKP